MKIIAFLFLLVPAKIIIAQPAGGIKLNPGMGGIHSTHIEDNLAYQDFQDSKITSWNVDQHWGFGFGFGAFFSYTISDRFSFAIEPTFNFLNCGIDFTREENDVDVNGDGNIKTETTESDIHLTYLNLPFLARYKFESRFYLLAGFGFDFMGTPEITSTASSQKDEYKNGALDKTTIDARVVYKTKLNVFESPRFDFIFGLGKSFDVNGKALNIDIRYNLPLTKSEMFTTDGSYNDGLFKHNDMLGLKGKTDAEHDAPFLLNDFKMGVVNLSIAYTLF